MGYMSWKIKWAYDYYCDSCWDRWEDKWIDTQERDAATPDEHPGVEAQAEVMDREDSDDEMLNALQRMNL